jgi:aminoglycoside phosphotransferase (APT) family kinase protein
VRLIASGRDADLFALGEATVLRRCRNPQSRCEPEAATMEWVRAHGYPAPQVHSVKGPDMVLDWVRGPTVLDSLLSGATTNETAARILVELHTQLHAIPPPPGRDGDGVVRHLDLHPENIIESPDGPVLIDWRNSDVGPDGIDEALTGLIIAQVAVSPIAEAPLANGVLDAYLTLIGRLDPSDVQAAVTYRSVDPNMSSVEVAILSSAEALLLT